MRRALLPALLTACAVLTGCFGPDPRHQAATKALIDASPQQARTIGAPSAWTMLAPSAGQWIRTLQTTTDGDQAVALHQVVAAEPGRFVTRVTTQDGRRKSVMTMHLSRVPTSADDAIDALQRMDTAENDGSPTTIDYTKGDGAMMKTMMRGHLRDTMRGFDGMEAKLAAAPKEAVTVPAGTFAGTAKVGHEFTVMGMTHRTTVWVHPAVPFGGMVKSQSEDGKYTTVLLDYGLKAP